MEGLEDMPDFWDMGDDEDAPGEHCDAMPEKGLPIIASKENPGIYRSNPLTPLSYCSSSFLRTDKKPTETSSTFTAAPKQLPNGNYEYVGTNIGDVRF